MSRSWTGWFAPWCPNRSRRVSAPAARPTIWCPRQMPEQRPAVVDDRPGERDRTVEPGRVAGAGREHDPRDVRGEDVGRGRGVRQDADPDAAPAEAADDVRLEPVVDDRDQRRRRIVADARATAAGETSATKSWSSQRGTARARSTAAVAVGRAGLGDDRRAATRSSAGGARAPGCRRRRWPGCRSIAGASRAGARRRGRPRSRWRRRGRAARAARTGRPSSSRP